jgi:hypothetical protein
MIAALRCVLLAALAASTASCLLPDGSVDVYGGVTNINDKDLRDVDEPTHYGAVAAVALDGGIVGMGIEAGYQKASEDDDSAGLEFDSDELYGGLRFNILPSLPIVKPYLAAGVSQLSADFEDGGNDFDDDGLGFYVRGGAALQLAFFRIGVDLRQTFGTDLDLGNVDDLDAFVASGFLGIGF